MEADLRDQAVDFVHHWHEHGFEKKRLISGLGIGMSKFYSWHERYGKVNDHNGKIPRDYWLTDWEKDLILNFQKNNSTEGYRRISYMMLDKDLVAVSPATTYRVLANAGLLKRWNEAKPSLKGSGFVQPLKPHEHWHIDISYLNLCGTFYYFIGILDGYSRCMVHWDIRAHGGTRAMGTRAPQLFRCAVVVAVDDGKTPKKTASNTKLLKFIIKKVGVDESSSSQAPTTFLEKEYRAPLAPASDRRR